LRRCKHPGSAGASSTCKTVDSKPLYWIANTPVTKDEVTYTIGVNVEDKLIVGVYTLDKSHNAPPDEWTRGRPIKLLIDGDRMSLKRSAAAMLNCES